MQVMEASIPAMLRERANLAPTATAFTFVDYQQDSAGVAESLTWSQLHRRVLNVASELTRCGSTGDRAVILAPQGLDYVVGFLGALQAGLVAVPLSSPEAGARDEHVRSVLRDSSAAVILTTSDVADCVTDYATPQSGESPPAVIEVDQLDLDSSTKFDANAMRRPDTAYLQYTSGSTRQPAGVVVSHKNLAANFAQVVSNYFEDTRVFPPETTVVSWVPLYHNMGLFIGVCAPILAGLHTVLASPVSFLQRPARWMQLLASYSRTFSPAPNFAFELAVRATSDDDMSGQDLGDVLAIIAGGERIHPATLRRFTERFARFNLGEEVIRPSYGLAEATVYVATRGSRTPPKIVRFESKELSAGHAVRCGNAAGTALVSYGVPTEPLIRIVDSGTGSEAPEGTVGEIWVHGDNVAGGYWRKPLETERTFGAGLLAPSAGTPESPWLRTGDLGAISEGELFIMGRIKDVVIVHGRNHYPDDIEATIQPITGGRVAAVSVPVNGTEQLVVIVELAPGGGFKEDGIGILESDVLSAVSESHGLAVADLVLVPPGSIPITRSGKVRRSACAERYRRGEFTRLEVGP
jgi:fatty acid CoA ligase FadD28